MVSEGFRQALMVLSGHDPEINPRIEKYVDGFVRMMIDGGHASILGFFVFTVLQTHIFYRASILYDFLSGHIVTNLVNSAKR